MDKLPSFMWANILNLLGVLIASIIGSIFSTFIVDRKKIIRKVQSRVLDLRVEQYKEIRNFIKKQTEVKIYPENCQKLKENLKISDLLLEGNEDCYSSYSISSPEKIKETLFDLEDISINGLYVLDDDVLGMILQIKIYVKNLDFFNILLKGYYDDKDYIGEEDIREIGEFYYHHLSILLNNEYQEIIGKLEKLVIMKSTKPKFEHKEKDYRQIKTRQKIQREALEKTILKKQLPQLIHLLASLCSEHLKETQEERESTIKDFMNYTIDIVSWKL